MDKLDLLNYIFEKFESSSSSSNFLVLSAFSKHRRSSSTHFLDNGEEKPFQRRSRPTATSFFLRGIFLYTWHGGSRTCVICASQPPSRVLDSTLAINQTHPVPRAPPREQPTEAKFYLKDKPLTEAIANRCLCRLKERKFSDWSIRSKSGNSANLFLFFFKASAGIDTRDEFDSW